MKLEPVDILLLISIGYFLGVMVTVASVHFGVRLQKARAEGHINGGGA